ncbi:putative opy2 protein [Rosellinia necatrix]|uniref:Putative opy2 protein n=1 Tax=Rosellinia necatrix TaxID=77044 RepID=A0A1S7UMT0_ROSNE|nr:putative opy2 protein [Rosellinia necatrix]
MAGIPGFVGFAVDEGVSSSLVKRQQGCVLCPDEPPDCPVCAADESCITVSQTCSECTRTICMLDPAKAAAKSNSGPNAGAIAGGVIGGLVLVAALTYLLWRFCIKNKRASYAEQWQGEGEHTKERAENDMASRRSQRESTHTVHSIASTVLTRASNIIQIAYIPGVTNRAPTSPTLLVPPVPPIPIAHAESATSSPYEDQHFFVPGDLRDSTYSGISSYTDRTSYARTSYAPRSSVASTIYGKNVVVSPAQKGNFLKPSLVSVKSRAASTNSDESAPPVPSVNYEKYEKPPSSPAFSIGATFLKNASASTATSVRPQVVRVASGPKTVDIRGNSSKSSSPLTTTTIAELESPDSPAHVRSGAGPSRDSAAITPIEEGTPIDDQGPFSDPPPMKSSTKRNSSLSAVIEESTRRASQIDPHRHPSTTIRDTSPFGDENAVRE